MSTDPTAETTPREILQAQEDVSYRLEGLGFPVKDYKDAAEVRAVTDRALSELLKLPGLSFTEQEIKNGLTVELIDQLSEKIHNFKNAESTESNPSTYQKLLKYESVVSNLDGATGQLSSLIGGAIGKDPKAMLLEEGVPEKLIPHMAAVYTILEDPRTFTGNLKTLVNAGVIGTRPEPEPVKVADAGTHATDALPAQSPLPPTQSETPVKTPTPSAPADPGTAQSQGEPAKTPTPAAPADPGTAQSQGEPAKTPTPDAPADPGTAQQQEPQPNTAKPPAQTAGAEAGKKPAEEEAAKPQIFDTAEAAGTAVERFLTRAGKKTEGIEVPKAVDKVFDDDSKALAWKYVEHIKKALKIQPEAGKEGLYDKSLRAKMFDPANEATKKSFEDALGGDVALIEFFNAMDTLADKGKLSEEPPAAESMGFLDEIKKNVNELRLLMAQIFGDDEANSMLQMVFAFIAQFLGPLLGHFGISSAPLFQAIGMDDMLDDKGQVSSEKILEDMKGVYERVVADIGNKGPDAVKDEVLEMFDKQVGEGTTLRKLLEGLKDKEGNSFVDIKAMRGALEKALEAAGEEPDATKRAGVFAGTAKAEAQKALKENPSAADPQLYKSPGPQGKPTEEPTGKSTEEPVIHARTVVHREDDIIEGKYPDKIHDTDPAYSRLSDRLSENPALNRVVAVDGLRILTAQMKSGNLEVHDLSAVLARDPDEFKVQEAIAAMQDVDLDTGDGDKGAVADFKKYYAATKTFVEFDTGGTAEGRMALRDARQAATEAAMHMDTTYEGRLIAERYGDKPSYDRSSAVGANSSAVGANSSAVGTNEVASSAATPGSVSEQFTAGVHGGADPDKEPLTIVANTSFSPVGKTIARFIMTADEITSQIDQNDKDNDNALTPGHNFERA